MSRRVKVDWVLPEEAIVRHIAEHMRDSDRQELRYGGVEPLTAIYASVACSKVSWAGLADGVPVCVFGGRDGTSGEPDCGLVWELGTAWIDLNWRVFARECRAGVDLVWKALSVPRVSNFVWDGNLMSRRWITWLGGSWSPEVFNGLDGSRFLRFTLERG